MKKFIYSLWTVCMVLGIAVLTGCSAEKYDAVDPNGRPDANEIDATVTVDQETNTYTLTLNNKGYYPMWKVNVGRNPKVSTTNGFTGVIAQAGTYDVEVRMGNQNGLSEGCKVYQIVIENDLGGDEFKGYKYDTDFNLWKTCNITDVSMWFANENWGQDDVTPPTIDVANEGFSFELPANMGSQQWQGQLLITTDIPTHAGTHYDFSVFLRAAAGHPGVTVKLQNAADDNKFYCADRVPLEAGKGKCFYISDVEGLEIENLKLVFDFGGGVPGSEIEVSNIVVKDHANDDGTEFPPAVEFDDNRNMFTNFTCVNLTTWFANASWSQDGITAPDVQVTSDGYYFTMPEGVGGEQWQGQVHMWTNVATSADKHYDFCMTFTCTQDHPGITIKIQKGDSLGEDGKTDDNVYFCLDRKAVKANVPYTYYFENLPGIDTQNIQVCCDYAGGVGGTEITVSNLHLQEHINK